MFGIPRRLGCGARRLATVTLLGVFALAALHASAAINLTGDVIPSPPAGDPWSVGGQLSVGDTFAGAMDVDGGSDVSNADGYVANNAGSNGTVTVSGAGSTWSNTGELRMGNFGTGTLNISAGGAVSVTGNARLGNAAGGIGTATVDGAGSMFTSDNFILVGREGNGTLDIQNSGVASDLIGGIAIFEGSTGAVTVSGLGAAWNNTNELQVADGGSATLNILAGARVTSGLGYLGVSADGVGTVTVSGPGSTWTNTNQLQVGYGGTGLLNILDGGMVTSPLGYLGAVAEGNGTVTVNGAGSAWINSGALSVGFAGVGTLNIENGGLVSAELLSGENGLSSVKLHGGTLRITSPSSSSNTIMLNGGGIVDVPNAADTVTITSNISGAGGMTKNGAGTLTLTSVNTYNGDTQVSDGTLNISQAFLDDLADVYLSPGVTFGLDFSGADSIDSLFIDGVSREVGTYGAIGSGADFEMVLFTGSGLLEVTSRGVPGDFNDDGIADAADYAVWRKRDALQASYDIWRTNFGKFLGAGVNTSTSSDVRSLSVTPEPASFMTFIIAWMSAAAIGRRW
jgi:T5SS/PEP-CTERM-associated repeat protein/autotransporter-associated beta strand protein